MAWVVDTSVVVDLVTGDLLFEPASTACLQAHLHDGLVISPVTFVELGPSFSGDDAAAAAFLKAAQIGLTEFWSPADTLLGHRLYSEIPGSTNSHIMEIMYPPTPADSHQCLSNLVPQLPSPTK